MIPGSANPLLLTSAAAAGGYEIERSLRFDSSSSAYLSKTFASAGNRKTWTWAGWVKRGKLSITNLHFFDTAGSPEYTGAYFTGNDTIEFRGYTSGFNWNLTTTPVFRDPSSWYHIVFVFDSTNGTSSDRLRLYVNGVRITTFSSSTYPTLNYDSNYNNSVAHTIGTFSGATGAFDGYLADIHSIDGQALGPTSFGEFDASGIWQPKAYSGTYPGNSFHLDFADNSTSAALGTDTSGNGNNWTTHNITAIERNYVADSTGTPFTGFHSLAYMFDGNLGTYMTPAAGTWAVFEPSPAISVSTIEIYGGWAEGVAGVKPKINNIEVTNGPTTFQWFTPTLTGGVSITSLQKLEFYSDSSTVAFHVGAIKINGSILISGSGAGSDSLVDVPTNGSETDTGIGGEVRGNYCCWNPLDKATNGTVTLTNGNLDAYVQSSSGIYPAARLTITPIQSSGKYQWEVTINSKTASFWQMGFNLVPNTYSASDQTATYRSDGYYATTLPGSWSGTPLSFTSGDIITAAIDNDAGTCKFYKNGSLGPTYTFSTLPNNLNFGVFADSSGGYSTYTLNTGQRPFAYPVSGFKSLNTANLPTPTIADGSTAMDVVLDTGANILTAAQGAIGGSADLLWIKDRANTNNHQLIDTVRGGTATLQSNTTSAETTYSAPSGNSVAWTWDAGSSSVTNTAGSITSTVRANPSAGFSIVSYAGTGANATIGHGLNAAPSFIIVKRRDASSSWPVYHSVYGGTKYILLNSGLSPAVDSTYWQDTAPTSSVFSVGTNTNVNASGGTYIAYCFTPIAGYSSVGTWLGNGSADGPFVHLGFRPAFVLLRRTGGTVPWQIIDTERLGYNVDNYSLFADRTDAETITVSSFFYHYDILSNGFKVRSAWTLVNSLNAEFIYIAFAEHPFALNARAR